MAGPELCVGALVQRGGELLMVQRGREPGKGLWSVPGGRVEPGEAMRDAVVRELMEETGLAGRCGELVGWLERIDEHHHFVIFDFAVDVDDHTAPVAGDDADQARFVSPGELVTMDLAGGVESFLRTHGFLP